jgi:hypothetical protein
MPGNLLGGPGRAFAEAENGLGERDLASRALATRTAPPAAA